MTISDAIRTYRAITDSDIRGETLIRRKDWSHGRVLVPGQYDVYVTRIGRYPAIPIPVELDTDELAADDWEMTSYSEMRTMQEKAHKERLRRRRISVNH